MKHAPIMSPAIDIEVTAGLHLAIDAVAGSAVGRNRFLTRSWFASAVGAAPVHTLVARRGDGRPVAAFTVSPGRWGLSAVPGCYWPHRAFPVAADLRDEEMAVLLGSGEAKKVLGRAWRVGPVYADDPGLLALKRAAGGSGWSVLERRIATSFLLDIEAARAEGPWPRNSTMRKNRFHEKHLSEHGALDWRFISGPGWTRAVFDDLAAIEAKSWHGKAEGADTKFLDPARRAFWEQLAKDPEQADRMRAAMLYVGGEPAAFSFDLDVGETKYAIANSYDPAFAKHSPGKCLYYRNLIEAAERGIRCVDWGAGDSGYKTTLGASPGAEIVDCLMVRPASLGRLIAPLWARSGQ